jgi:MFS transporter, ACS family, pantothenate transporter
MQAYIVQGLMLLYLKAHQADTGFTQSQINTYPIPTHAIGIVAEFGASIAIDRYNRRLSLGYFFCAIQIACSIVLLVPNMSMGGHLAALYLSSTSYGINPLLYSWSNIIAARTADDAARSVILASMAASDGLLWTFWGIVFYPASDAPYWRKGYITLLCVCAVLCCWLFVVRWVSNDVAAVCSIKSRWSNIVKLDRHTAKKHPATTPLLSAAPAPTVSPSALDTNEKKI